MKLGDVAKALASIAPEAAAAAWDNVGLLAGDPAAEVTRALVAIDLSTEVVEEAARAGCELVVAYHPPIFTPLRAVLAGGEAAAAYAAIRRGIAIYSPHTALDAASGGTNDVLAGAVGLSNADGARAPLARVEAKARGATTGLGRVGELTQPATREELVARTKRALGVEHALVAGPRDGRAVRVAVCAGSGGDFVGDAIAAGADVYVTGEVRHHEALRASRAGLTVVCVRHSVSERLALAPYARRIEAEAKGVIATVSAVDRDPFDFV